MVILGPFFAWIFVSGPLYPWILWLKPVLRGLWEINVYLGALMFCKDLFPLIFSQFLRQIGTNLAFFGHFGSFFCLNFYFWTFIPMNIMVKTSFERSMGHKRVLTWVHLCVAKTCCNWVFQILLQIVTNFDFFGHFGAFFFYFFFSDLYTIEYYG